VKYGTEEGGKHQSKMKNKEVTKSDITFIKSCVNFYIEFLGDSYTLASYKVNSWNYCGYRTIDRQ